MVMELGSSAENAIGKWHSRRHWMNEWLNARMNGSDSLFAGFTVSAAQTRLSFKQIS